MSLIQVSVRVIGLSLRLQLITSALTSIILDIYKKSSNNCLIHSIIWLHVHRTVNKLEATCTVHGCTMYHKKIPLSLTECSFLIKHENWCKNITNVCGTLWIPQHKLKWTNIPEPIHQYDPSTRQIFATFDRYVFKPFGWKKVYSFRSSTATYNHQRENHI